MSVILDVNPDGTVRDLAPDIRIAHILYILHALAPFTAWLLAIGAIIIGYVKRDDVRGTFLASHFSWLARTFWWGLLWVIVCAIIVVILYITLVGIIVAWLPPLILIVWYLYRVIRGWLKLNGNLPIG